MRAAQIGFVSMFYFLNFRVLSKRSAMAVRPERAEVAAAPEPIAPLRVPVRRPHTLPVMIIPEARRLDGYLLIAQAAPRCVGEVLVARNPVDRQRQPRTRAHSLRII